MSCYLLLLKTVEKSKKKINLFLYRTKSFMILEETVLRNLEKLFLRSFTNLNKFAIRITANTMNNLYLH